MAAEGVAHSRAHIAAKRGVTESVLILLVEEICGAGVKRYAVAYAVAAGQIEARIAGISFEAEAKEIAVGADASKIAA